MCGRTVAGLACAAANRQRQVPQKARRAAAAVSMARVCPRVQRPQSYRLSLTSIKYIRSFRPYARLGLLLNYILPSTRSRSGSLLFRLILKASGRVPSLVRLVPPVPAPRDVNWVALFSWSLVGAKWSRGFAVFYR